jgi:formate dehydrogenase major subunit
MTNHWIDIRNADVILISGSNAAENHPISFKYVMEAKSRGAKLLSVDPRFTRTSSKADVFAPMRSGADIAFLGGMINYIFENKRYNEEYCRLYTNSSFLVNPSFKMPGEMDGVFSGLKGAQKLEGIGWVNGKYDKATWSFQKGEDGIILKDKTLSDPNCVFQLLKRHFSRYTPDLVSKISGTPKDLLLKIYDIYTTTGQTGKAGTIMYAMGWTQHTVGTQNIRTMAIIQLLLGNMGVAGGGVNALRGESNVQGSTDHCLLFHILPGYLGTPNASQATLADYNKRWAKSADPLSANWWQNGPKYIASLIRAHYGTGEDLETQYQYFPKLDVGQNASWLMLFDIMSKGGFQGFFAWGQNPAGSGSNAGKVRKALAKLKWMVNVNIFDSETGSFWKEPGVNPSEIKTEVFQLPAAAFYEKTGSVTNSGRWSQWRYKAVDPPGEARPDADMITELQFRVAELYKKEGGAFPDPVTKLDWSYGTKDMDGKVVHTDTILIAKEINGYFLEDKQGVRGSDFKKGDLVPSFAFLQEDGSTSSGNWLYCQSFNANGNAAARRGKSDPSGIGLHPGWAWCWPVNRRIIYNRASVDEYGRPWDKEHPVIFWNGKKWIGDVPDGGWPPMRNPDGTPNPKTKYAYIMKPEGHAHIFGPGRAEGPFPEHYEPLECPTETNLMSPQKLNPISKIFGEQGMGEGMDRFLFCDPRYPYIATTYRVTEHWQTGIMTRHVPSLVELQPGNFCEMSPELAEKEGIKNGDIVEVSSARGKVDAVAIVTKRFRPFNLGGETVHQVGLPWHYGWATTKEGVYQDHKFPTFGDSANLLTPTVGDANTMIPETKAFMVNVKGKGVA